MNACKLRLCLGLAAGALVLARPERAAAITVGAEVVLRPAGGATCFWNPDIAFGDGLYFLSYVEGPCTGSGAFAVRLGVLDPLAPGALTPITVRMVSASARAQIPLVRVSTSLSTVTVAVVDRALSTNSLYTHSYTGTSLAPLGMMGPFSMAGAVQSLSFDCAAGALPPCVATTMEIAGPMVSARGFAYFNAGAPSMLVPPGARMDLAIATAAFAGAPTVNAALFVTDSAREVVPHALALVSPSTVATIGGVSALPYPAIVGVHTRGDGVLAAWSVGNKLEYRAGPRWGSLSIAGSVTMSNISALMPEGGAQLGASLVIAGRNVAGRASLDEGTVTYVGFPPVSAGQNLMATGTSSVARSAVRIAGSARCPSSVLGVSVYATGATTPQALQMRLLRCNEPSDCVDPNGVGGMCVSNVCTFAPPSVCAMAVDGGLVDAGRDASVDATVGDAMPLDGMSTEPDSGTISMDVIAPPDASTNSDSAATMDGREEPDGASSDAAPIDASSADGGGPDGGAVDGPGPGPSITGGACACRAPARPARGALPVLAALSVIALCASARPRRRQRA